MRLWKKILLALLAIILLAQIPFVYRRIQYGRLASKIRALEAQKIETANVAFNDYKGVVHVHTAIGGHSTGSFAELVDGASKNQLDFVVMTEHTEEFYDTSALTLSGKIKNVLFVNGQEVETATDRFLLLPGSADSNRANKMQTAEFLQKAHAENRLAFVTYPEKHKTWNADFDGIEIFSLHTNAKKMNFFLGFFDLVWSSRSYPDLVLANYFERADENLRKFDEITIAKKSTLFAGTDAHSNIGFHLFGDDAGNKFLNVKIDRYETVFRPMRNHVLIEKDKPLTQETLLQALKHGRSYIAVDALSDAKGFSFFAENGAEQKTLGDEIAQSENLVLKISAPQIARFLIFKNGEKVYEQSNVSQINFPAREKGTYRTEVYLDALGVPFDRTPWIVSNPIYVK